MRKYNLLLNSVAAFALLLADSASTNSSYIWIYQPKFPEKLRRL